MNITTQHISARAEETIKICHRVMRSKGFKMTSRVLSAGIHFRYQRPDIEYTIEMHHGRGKWGPGKAIIALYLPDHSEISFSPVPEDRSGEYKQNDVDRHRKACDDILEYIMSIS